MPTAIPPVLAPYLQSCYTNESPTLITSVLDTPANWLLLAFTKAALFGVDDDAGPTNSSTPSSIRVIFVSFLRSHDFWVELGKKNGLDFVTLTATKRLAYTDGLTVGVNVPQSTSKAIKPRSLSLADISQALNTALTSISPDGRSNGKVMLVVDGIDFVLASQPDISALHLNAFITETCDKFSSMVLTASADSPLLHNTEASSTPLELEHSIFVRTVAHQCGWVLQLRPLETGHAKDVSGVVQISRGGAMMEVDGALDDGEWLYQVKGDGNVRVWGRGDS